MKPPRVNLPIPDLGCEGPSMVELIDNEDPAKPLLTCRRDWPMKTPVDRILLETIADRFSDIPPVNSPAFAIWKQSLRPLVCELLQHLYGSCYCDENSGVVGCSGRPAEVFDGF